MLTQSPKQHFMSKITLSSSSTVLPSVQPQSLSPLSTVLPLLQSNQSATVKKMALKINLHFGGGAELLFDKIKKREVELPALNKYLPVCQKEKWSIRELLVWMKSNLLKERPELFLQGDSVRPGILVLINDADWELYGELNYEIKDNDTIMFISTLHGG